MKTIDTVVAKRASFPLPSARASARRHIGAGQTRLSTWRVLGATVAGFPAFLWQLTKSREN